MPQLGQIQEKETFGKYAAMAKNGRYVSLKNAADDFNAAVIEVNEINRESKSLRKLKKIAAKISNNEEFMKHGRRIIKLDQKYDDLTECEKAYYVLLHSETRKTASTAMNDIIYASHKGYNPETSSSPYDVDSAKFVEKAINLVKKDPDLQTELQNFSTISQKRRKYLIKYLAQEIGFAFTGESPKIKFFAPNHFDKNTGAYYNSIHKEIRLNKDNLKNNANVWQENLQTLLNQILHENMHHAQNTGKMEHLPPLLHELSEINYISPVTAQEPKDFFEQPIEMAPRIMGDRLSKSIMNHFVLQKDINK